MDPDRAEELLNSLAATVQRFLTATDVREIDLEWHNLRRLLTDEDLRDARLTHIRDTQRRIERMIRDTLPALMAQGVVVDLVDPKQASLVPFTAPVYRPTLWDRLHADDKDSL